MPVPTSSLFVSFIVFVLNISDTAPMGEIVRDILPDSDEYNTITQNKTKQLGWCGIIIVK